MKRIAIFCDGTWSGLTTGEQTNIAKFARAVMPLAADGVTQLVYYQPGLGVAPAAGIIGRSVIKWAGGAFGWGLNAQLEAAYRQLIFWYEPGDEVYIFGYSRGAYLARSLVGLIRLAGIPSQQAEGQITRAIRFYRQRNSEDKLDTEETLSFRHALSPLTATSPKDLEWRQARGDAESYFFRLRYLGVWDTVGALGIPGVLGVAARMFNQRYAFHNGELTQMVVSARHAVAIDERRRLYPPTLWRNLGHLNEIAETLDTPYRQHWFPGNHSIVGGSGPAPGLSAFPAKWVLDGARKLSLHFERGFLENLIATAQADAPVPGGFDPDGMTYALLGRLLLADRDQLRQVGDVSQAAIDRYAALETYRPGTLRNVMKAMTKTNT